MAHFHQIRYIELFKNEIKEPILIVASKMYDYDNFDISKVLQEWGFKDITGIDLFAGDGVDHVVDMTDTTAPFFADHAVKYKTVIAMEFLTHVTSLENTASNIKRVMAPGGIVIISDAFVRKLSRMPLDLWRVGYEGQKQLFREFKFNDSDGRMSVLREKKDQKLLRLDEPFPQILHTRHPDETAIGYLLRRIHRKFFSKGIFQVSRLMPEMTFYSMGRKQS